MESRRGSYFRQSGLQQQLLIWILMLLCALAFGAGAAQAQSISYVRDANGRVVAVTANNGNSAKYSYDTLGHTGQVSAPVSAGRLAIFAFMPMHGEVGAQVTIQGQGFDSNPANDTVSFNGAEGTVLSATPTQLVTTVPSGASTGPISVTADAQTATSAMSFVVDDTGLPPSITQVSPAIVSAGSTVTVAGTHLDPIAGNTAVQMGGYDVSLSAATDAQLQYTVPSDGLSGYVTVQTPYGSASSSAPVFVLPSGVSVAGAVSSGVATVNGASVPINIGVGGQTGVVMFSGTEGNWMSLQLNNVTTTASQLTYQIYAPGNVLVQSGTVSASSPSIHLPSLTVSGNYLAIFQPNTAGAQFTVQAVSDPTLALSSSLTQATTGSAQSARAIFVVPANSANLELELVGLNVTGGGQNQANVQVTSAAGSVVASFSCPGSATTTNYCHQWLWNMAAGTYAVTVSPSNGGTLAFNTLLQPDVIGPSLTPNTPLAVNMTAGQMERLTFAGTAGQTVALSITGVSTTPAGQFLAVFVYTPGTSNLTMSNYYALVEPTSSGILNLPNLPATGTYTVIIGSGNSVPVSGQLTLVSGVSGVIPDNGASQSYATSANGQNAYLSFTANAGDNLELELVGLNVTGGGQNQANVQVANAAGTVIASFSCPGSATTTNYCHQWLWNMAAGTYAITVSPSNGGTLTFNALLQPDVIGSPLVANAPVAVNLTAGQMERFTFTATAGQTVALSAAGVNTTPAGQFLAVLVYAPGTGAPTMSNYYTLLRATSSGILNLPNLPATGTYTVIIGSGNSVPVNGQLTLVSGVGGTLPDNGTSQSYATSVSGQNAYLNFTANAGDNLELELVGLNVTGGSQNQANVQVTNAAGTVIASFSCAGSATTTNYCNQPLWNMAAGTYAITVFPSNGGTLTFNAVLQPDVIGPSLTINAPQVVNLTAGQMERLTFAATAGQPLALSISGVSTSPAGQFLAAYVYAPGTTIPTMSNYYALVQPTSSGILSLPNLPATGTYTVIIGSANNVPVSAQLTLESGFSQSYGTSVSGQNAYLNFVANAGDNLELELVGLNVTGGSQNQANVQVINAGGSGIASISCPGSATTTNYCHQWLWNMAAGTYAITVSPSGGGTLAFNTLLQPDVIGPSLTPNTPLAVNMTAGQMERLTFTGTAGQTVALSVSGVSTTPAGQFLAVFVYTPGTSNLTMGNYYAFAQPTSAGTLNLPNLPATGTYTVIIGSGNSVPVSAQLTLVPQ